MIRQVFIPIDVTKELPKLSGCYFVVRGSVSSPLEAVDFDNTTNQFLADKVTHYLKEVELVIPDDEEIRKALGTPRAGNKSEQTFFNGTKHMRDYIKLQLK